MPPWRKTGVAAVVTAAAVTVGVVTVEARATGAVARTPGDWASAWAVRATAMMPATTAPASGTAPVAATWVAATWVAATWVVATWAPVTKAAAETPTRRRRTVTARPAGPRQFGAA